MADSDWLVRRGNEIFRASDFETVRSWAASGRMIRADEVWVPASSAWLPALHIQALADIFGPPRKCPIDAATMIPGSVLTTTVDRCPVCGGVWLDGGELEAIRETMTKESSSEFANGLMMGMVLS